MKNLFLQQFHFSSSIPSLPLRCHYAYKYITNLLIASVYHVSTLHEVEPPLQPHVTPPRGPIIDIADLQATSPNGCISLPLMASFRDLFDLQRQTVADITVFNTGYFRTLRLQFPLTWSMCGVICLIYRRSTCAARDLDRCSHRPQACGSWTSLFPSLRLYIWLHEAATATGICLW